MSSNICYLDFFGSVFPPISVDLIFSKPSVNTLPFSQLLPFPSKLLAWDVCFCHLLFHPCHSHPNYSLVYFLVLAVVLRKPPCCWTQWTLCSLLYVYSYNICQYEYSSRNHSFLASLWFRLATISVDFHWLCVGSSSVGLSVTFLLVKRFRSLLKEVPLWLQSVAVPGRAHPLSWLYLFSCHWVRI